MVYGLLNLPGGSIYLVWKYTKHIYVFNSKKTIWRICKIFLITENIERQRSKVLKSNVETFNLKRLNTNFKKKINVFSKGINFSYL